MRIPNLSHFGISANFAPSPRGSGGGEGGKPQAYIQVSRFRKKSSERSSERLSRREAAHFENERGKFRQNGTLKPFQKGKYDEIQSNPFIVYCRSLGACCLQKHRSSVKQSG